MKKTLKTLLVAMFIVPLMFTFAACSSSSKAGGGDIKDGTYKFSSMVIDGKTITMPTLPAEPVVPTRPVSYEHTDPADIEARPPSMGTLKVETGYASEAEYLEDQGTLTANETIVAKAQWAVIEAQYYLDKAAVYAEQAVWDAKKASYTTWYNSTSIQTANAAAWEKYEYEVTAYCGYWDTDWADDEPDWDNVRYYISDGLYYAWLVNCQLAYVDALKDAGLSDDAAYEASEGISMIMSAINSVRIEVKGDKLGLAVSMFGENLYFADMSYIVNEKGEIVLDTTAGLPIPSEYILYKNGAISIGMAEDEHSIAINFKK